MDRIPGGALSRAAAAPPTYNIDRGKLPTDCNFGMSVGEDFEESLPRSERNTGDRPGIQLRDIGIHNLPARDTTEIPAVIRYRSIEILIALARIGLPMFGLYHARSVAYRATHVCPVVVPMRRSVSRFGNKWLHQPRFPRDDLVQEPREHHQ